MAESRYDERVEIDETWFLRSDDAWGRQWSLCRNEGKAALRVALVAPDHGIKYWDRFTADDVPAYAAEAMLRQVRDAAQVKSTQRGNRFSSVDDALTYIRNGFIPNAWGARSTQQSWADDALDLIEEEIKNGRRE